MRVQITNETGQGHKTSIKTEAGEDLSGCVRSVVIRADANSGMVKAELEMVRIPFDMLALVTAVTMHEQFAEIILEDGEQVQIVKNEDDGLTRVRIFNFAKINNE